jgi:DNA-binding transcriptional LysR family regulator
MELRHLRYFVAVAEEQHVGRAALRLHVSPPALSKCVRELEEELRTPLFARVGRGLKLVRSGRVLLERARAVLADVARAAAAAQAAGRGEIGHLAVGFVESATFATMIPQVVERMRRRHPGVTLELVPVSWSDQIPALLDGRIGAVFCYHPPDDGRIRAVPLLLERIVIALPRRHPLAARRAVSARDLQGEPFVWMPPAAIPAPLRRVMADFAVRGLSPNVVVEARSSTTRLGLVAAGMGVTALLESTRSVVPPGIVLRPLSDAPFAIQSVLAWRTEDDADRVVGSLRDIANALASARRPRGQPSTATAS